MFYIFKFILDIVAVFILFILTFFSLRRILFGIVAILSRLKKDSVQPVSYQPTVTILIPCHNEEIVIAKCLESLTQLTYPKEKLEIAVCDDGSTDNALNIAKNFEKRFDFIHTFSIPVSKGKAAVMNLALERFKKGEIVYIFDADSRPRPDCLTNAVRHFASPSVGAVSGLQPVRNKYDNFISYYAFIERIFFQWNVYANDKLFLGAGFSGSNCGIRRALLERVGFFDENCLIEDVSLEVKVYENRSRIKYVHDAIAEQEVPNTLKGYFYQRLGWVKGMNELIFANYKDILLNKKIDFVQKARCFVLLCSYWDRIFFAIVGLMTLYNLVFSEFFPIPYWMWLIFLGAPFFQTIAYLVAERSGFGLYIRLPIIAILFPLFEFLVAYKGFLEDSLGKERIRYKTPRKQIRNS